jgi:hypothetical protein
MLYAVILFVSLYYGGYFPSYLLTLMVLLLISVMRLPDEGNVDSLKFAVKTPVCKQAFCDVFLRLINNKNSFQNALCTELFNGYCTLSCCYTDMLLLHINCT